MYELSSYLSLSCPQEEESKCEVLIISNIKCWLFPISQEHCVHISKSHNSSVLFHFTDCETGWTPCKDHSQRAAELGWNSISLTTSGLSVLHSSSKRGIAEVIHKGLSASPPKFSLPLLLASAQNSTIVEDSAVLGGRKFKWDKWTLNLRNEATVALNPTHTSLNITFITCEIYIMHHRGLG